MEKLWTTSEAAACLGVPETEIERLVKSGVLTGYKLGGKFLRFRPEQVEALKGRVNRAAQSQPVEALTDSFPVRVSEFYYFNDFYIVSTLLVGGLLAYVLWIGQ